MTLNSPPSLGPGPRPVGAVAARVNWLVAGAFVVVLALILGFATGLFSRQKDPASNAAANRLAPLAWVAAAPGRVEPRTGEIRISAGMLGRVAEVLVAVNDRVEEGELLIRLDDDEAQARLASASAEAGARRRERDGQPATAGREDVRRAEDAVYTAHRAVTAARLDLDAALVAKRKGQGTDGDQRLTEARKRLQEAQERLQREQVTLTTAQAKPGLPVPNRIESSLTAARAEVEVADALLDKTRVRAPINATVLQLTAKTGELVAPAPDQALVVIGDLSIMRVKAELDERDVGKVKIGQKAFVRSDSFAGRDFEGRISAIAPSLAAQRIVTRGPRRPNDVEVLEVTVDLDGAVPLLPGMRVDAYFRKD